MLIRVCRLADVNKTYKKRRPANWAFGAVGSALERHSRGHKFEPCNAHHLKGLFNKVLFCLGLSESLFYFHV